MENSPVPKPGALLTRIFLSPDEPRLRAGWRIAGQLLLMLLFTILFGRPLLAVFNQVAWPDIFAASNLVGFLATTFSVMAARRWLDRRRFASLGLKLGKEALKDLLVGFGIAALMMGLIFAAHLAFGWASVKGFVWEEQSPRAVIGLAGYWLAAFAMVGWSEELLFRGYYLRNLSEGLSAPAAVVITSVFFSLGHGYNPNAGPIPLVGLFLAGLFFAFAYLRTRALWLPIGLHFGWNLFEGTVFGFPVSGIDISPLIRLNVTGPEILTGGAFGPEAGLILVPVMAVGAGLIWLYARSMHSEH